MKFHSLRMTSLYYNPSYATDSLTKVMRINKSAHKTKQPLHSPQYRDERQDNLSENQLSPLQRLQHEYRGMLEQERERKIALLHQKYEEKSLKTLEKFPNYSRKHRNQAHDQQHRTIINRKSAGYGVRNPRPRQLPPINYERSVPKAQSFHGQNEMSDDVPSHSQNAQNGHTPVLPERSKHRSKYADMKSEGDRNGHDGHVSPPPNIQHLRLLRERKMQQKRMKNINNSNFAGEQHPPGTRKLSEFERWQQQQDMEKISRLQKFHEKQAQESSQTIDLEFGAENTSTKIQQPLKRGKKQNLGNGVPMTKTKRSASPVIQTKSRDLSQRQDALRQKIREEEIEKLKEELRRRQEELKLMQKARLDSCGNGLSGSDNESEHEFPQTSHQKPRVKPPRVKNTDFWDPQQQHQYQAPSRPRDQTTPSELSFQMKPVLFRRDSGRNSRATPKFDLAAPLPKVKQEAHQRRMPAVAATKHQVLIPPVHKPTPPPSPPSRYSPSDDDDDSVPREVSRYTIPEGGFDDEGKANMRLVPCKICGRKFSDERLSKHMKVCSKTTNKKRKVFNMRKVRVRGTEMEKYTREHSIMRRETPPKKESNWRTKHENFIRAIRDAKTYQQHLAHGGKASDLPPPPPTENPDYVQCQYCQRKFAPAVAERHIPRCKDIKSRPRPPRR